ncbi:hypothetical protein HK101_000508 [Irineochytrium annulatum]|nr:hypothetical protein HK101_000508 [Irineochytrium annulatum]
MSTELKLPLVDDFHVHLRQAFRPASNLMLTCYLAQGALMKAVVPLLKTGGVRTAYVMVCPARDPYAQRADHRIQPNLKPPICTTDQALSYKRELTALEPDVEFLMTLYLNPDLTPDEIRKAAKAGIAGVKSYPRGVTTNSDGGIESYTAYYDVFRAMEEVDMVLNLHGEIPSDPTNDVCVLNAEERFLKHLTQLHADFPKLRIVLEHATTKAAVDLVKALGPTIGCTITIHHLELIVDDWAGQCHNFCKPVAKFPHDREALRDVVKEGHPRFFLGTDSAPHPRSTKETAVGAAGVFTGPYVAQYLAQALESFGALGSLRKFACENGRAFYKMSGQPLNKRTLKLTATDFAVDAEFPYKDDGGVMQAVVPYKAGKKLKYSISVVA